MELSANLFRNAQLAKKLNKRHYIKHKEAKAVKSFETVTRTIFKSPKNRISTKIHATLEHTQQLLWNIPFYQRTDKLLLKKEKQSSLLPWQSGLVLGITALNKPMPLRMWLLCWKSDGDIDKVTNICIRLFQLQLVSHSSEPKIQCIVNDPLLPFNFHL